MEERAIAGRNSDFETPWKALLTLFGRSSFDVDHFAASLSHLGEAVGLGTNAINPDFRQQGFADVIRRLLCELSSVQLRQLCDSGHGPGIDQWFEGPAIPFSELLQGFSMALAWFADRPPAISSDLDLLSAKLVKVLHSREGGLHGYFSTLAEVSDSSRPEAISQIVHPLGIERGCALLCSLSDRVSNAFQGRRIPKGLRRDQIPSSILVHSTQWIYDNSNNLSSAGDLSLRQHVEVLGCLWGKLYSLGFAQSVIAHISQVVASIVSHFEKPEVSSADIQKMQILVASFGQSLNLLPRHILLPLLFDSVNYVSRMASELPMTSTTPVTVLVALFGDLILPGFQVFPVSGNPASWKRDTPMMTVDIVEKYFHQDTLSRRGSFMFLELLCALDLHQHLSSQSGDCHSRTCRICKDLRVPAVCSNPPPKEDQMLLPHSIVALANLWSSPSCVRYFSHRRHKAISLALSRSLQLFNSLRSGNPPSPSSPSMSRILPRRDPVQVYPPLSDFSSVMSSVMDGVQERLGSSVEDIRFLGMRVAERFSQCLSQELNRDSNDPEASAEDSPEDPIPELKFGDLPEEDSMSESDEVMSHLPNSLDNGYGAQLWWLLPITFSPPTSEAGDGSSGSGRFTSQPTLHSTKKQPDNIQLNPGEYVRSSVPPDFDTSEDDDDDLELEAFSLHDDDDSSEVSQPAFLHQVLEALRSAHDHPDSLESALRAAPTLIVSEPDDLMELAEQLCTALLLAGENSFLIDRPSLQHLRMKSLVLLAAQAPLIAIPRLTSLVYADNQTLQQRLDILRILSLAAAELGQLEPTHLSAAISHSSLDVDLSSTPSSAPDSIPESSTSGLRSEGFRSGVSVRPRFRRWGYSRTPSANRALLGPKRQGVNRFADLAPMFFYPLLRQDALTSFLNSPRDQPSTVPKNPGFIKVSPLLPDDDPQSSSSMEQSDAPPTRLEWELELVTRGADRKLPGSNPHPMEVLDPAQDDLSHSSGWSYQIDLWNRDHLLLSQLLLTLSGFVEVSGRSQPHKTKSMCRALLDVLYHTRSHHEVAVRRATFYGLLRVLSVLEPPALLTHFAGDVQFLTQWLSSFMKSPEAGIDPQTTQLAQLCLISLRETLSDPHFLMTHLPETAKHPAQIL